MHTVGSLQNPNHQLKILGFFFKSSPEDTPTDFRQRDKRGGER